MAVAMQPHANFYLLVERGPATFDVRAADEPPTFRARVSLGSECFCSACRWRGQPCRHARWVLQKIFGVPLDSPLMSRTGLSARELDALLDARPRQQAVRADRLAPRAAGGPLRPESVQWLLALSGQDAHLLLSGAAAAKAGGKPAGRARPRRRALDADEVCAICMEEMTDDPAEAARTGGELVWCKVSCGRSTHARCLAAWATHNVQPGLAVRCPLCRAEWPCEPAGARAEEAERAREAEHARAAQLLGGLAALDARERAAREGGGIGDPGGVQSAPPASSPALRWFQRQQTEQSRSAGDGPQPAQPRGAQLAPPRPDRGCGLRRVEHVLSARAPFAAAPPVHRPLALAGGRMRAGGALGSGSAAAQRRASGAPPPPGRAAGEAAQRQQACAGKGCLQGLRFHSAPGFGRLPAPRDASS